MRSLVMLFILATSPACSAERPVEADNPVTEAILLVPAISPNSPPERNSAVRIVTSDGNCSATKLATKTLLSAAHCFRTARRVVVVDGQPALIQRVLGDGNDHSLILIEGIELKDFATLGKPPLEGDNIHYWGNPFIFSMLLRRGYVSGFNRTNTIYDVNGYHGDSGAGIFSVDNKLVGVISFIQGHESFTMMGSYPLNFTQEQLAAVGLKPDPLLMSGIKANVVLDYGD